MRKGSKIYDSGANNPEIDKYFRSMGLIGPNGDYAGVVAINRDAKDVTKTFRIAEEFTDSGKIYLYIYNENELKIGEDGFVKENQVLEMSLKDQIEITVPSDTVVILSSKEL